MPARFIIAVSFTPTRPIFKKAITDYTERRAHRSCTLQAYLNRGNAFKSLEISTTRLGGYREAHRIAPNDATVLTARGSIYFSLGNKQQAAADFEQVISISIRIFRTGYLGLGYSCSIFPETGTRAASNITTRRSMPIYILRMHSNNRGSIRKSVVEPERSLYDFDQAIICNPGNPMPFYNRGLVFANRGEYAKAISDFQESIRRDPRNTDAASRLRAASANCSVDFCCAMEKRRWKLLRNYTSQRGRPEIHRHFCRRLRRNR